MPQNASTSDQTTHPKTASILSANSSNPPEPSDAALVKMPVLDESGSPLSEVADIPELAESYADELINEVFEDIDRILDHGLAVSDEPKSSDAVSFQPVAMQDVIHQSGLASPDDHESLFHAGDRDQSVDSTETSDSNQGIIQILGSILPVLAVCASLGLALSAGIARYSQQATNASPEQLSQSLPSDPANADFLAYMDQALTAIQRKAEASQVSSNPVEKDLSNPSTASASSETPSPASSPDDNVLERVYIPVYQPPQTFASLPTVPIQESLPAPVVNQSPNQSSNQAPAPPTPSQPAPTASAPPAPQNIAPSTAHALVGLLQLGDRSAAIFEFGGTAHRIAVGEQIGSSGWSLVSVSNDEAIIRRNGEVRSIYIGQTF